MRWRTVMKKEIQIELKGMYKKTYEKIVMKHGQWLYQGGNSKEKQLNNKEREI